MKKLVIFYSFEGNTKFIANSIAKSINADTLEIKPVQELKTKGFMKYVWGGKQATMKEKPELNPLSKNPEEYDVIFIGTPVWAFTFSPPIRSFIFQTKLNKKKIALFCCHEGNPGNTLENMKRKLEGNEIIGKIDFNSVFKNKKACFEKAVNWAKCL
jgi:flavodoxin